MVVESDSEKKRKITRACDICRSRRKKIKCDGPSKAEQGLKCTNCNNNNFTCTYVEAAKRKGPPKGYIEFEMLFRKMLPDYDYNSEVGAPIDRDSFETGCEADTSRWNKEKMELPTIEKAFHPTKEIDDQSDDELEERMQQISLSAQCEDNTRYLGKSSSMYLMATLDQYKPPDEPLITREYIEQDRRPEFWMDSEWIMEENKDFPSISYSVEELPPPDLLDHLVKIFFERFNVYFPVLHRATFEADLHKRKHDVRFGGLILLLCAAASRYSDDPRVVPKDDKDEFGNVKNWRFAGAEFFAKFKMHCHNFILTAARLEDLQSIILMVVYLQGGPFSHACWALNSVGLVLAQVSSNSLHVLFLTARNQDIGFHRKRVWGDPIQNELRKRAFWSFYVMDKRLSAVLGRPCTLNDENFDVELPSVLPDEVETEMQVSIAQFNKLIELTAILGEVLRTSVGTILYNLYHSDKNSTLLTSVNVQIMRTYLSQSAH
ncbi:hypothetical protein E3Q18_04104 [Wallemia mellicola]|nr:hypothetical protein E3Q18_04104 [Wallemia mellicola]